MRHDTGLSDQGVTLDFGRFKNKNSNSVVDKGIQELEAELLKIGASGRAVTPVELRQALHVLNSRVRNRGLSAKEILFQRDQLASEQLHFDDSALSNEQKDQRVCNHSSSPQSKTPEKSVANSSNISVGDLVFLKDERNKNKLRDLVVELKDDKAFLQKLTKKFMSRK